MATLADGYEKKRAKLSLIIATYNGRESIGRCLDSLLSQSIDPNLYQVIVVDNNSIDGTGKIVSEYSKTHYNILFLSEFLQGVSHARNKGIAAAKGDYICFIDDDAYADHQWLEGILNAFETVNPPPAVVGGKILPYYTTDKPAWFTDSLEVRGVGKSPRFLSPKECVFGFPESNFCIRKTVLDEIGGFSPALGPKAEAMAFGEGIELSGRIAQKYPYFWYDPNIIVYHLVPKRNMSVRYILVRNFKTAQGYQAAESKNAGRWRNVFTFGLCTARTAVHALLSILLVRWFSRKAVSDWLKQAIPLTNCLARSLYLIKNGFSPLP